MGAKQPTKPLGDKPEPPPAPPRRRDDGGPVHPCRRFERVSKTGGRGGWFEIEYPGIPFVDYAAVEMAKAYLLRPTNFPVLDERGNVVELTHENLGRLAYAAADLLLAEKRGRERDA